MDNTADQNTPKITDLKKPESNTVDKDELIGSAIAIDAAGYIMQELMEDFFESYNPQNEGDHFKIIYEFSRYRAKANVLIMLLNQISNEFKANKITAY